MIEILAQVMTPPDVPKPFCAGIVLWDDKVVVTAPILRKWFAGKTRDQVREICRRQGWTVTVVHEITRPDEKPGKEYR